MSRRANPLRGMRHRGQARRTARVLTAALEALADGDYSIRVPEVATEPRFARLERSFNEMAASLERRRSEAEEETHAREAFFAQVSHEFRTPLTSIVGYGDMLLADARGTERVEPEERIEALETTDRNARRLLRLVNDLLFAARVGADMLRIQHADFDLATIVRQAVDAAEPAANSAGVRLEAELPDALPVRGDAGRLTQAIDNLLANAIKFMDSGGRVGVRLAVAGERAVLEVWDTGPGIPAEALPRLFERFYRGPEVSEVRGHGVGLGLPIAKAIVEAHGGRIDVSSIEGEGSTFTIVLPLSR